MKIEKIQLEKSDFQKIEDQIIKNFSYPNLKIDDTEFSFSLDYDKSGTPMLSECLNLSISFDFKGSIDPDLLTLSFSEAMELKIFNDNEGCEIELLEDSEFNEMHENLIWSIKNYLRAKFA